MALFTHLLVGAALVLSLCTFFSGSEAGDVGVCYGMQGSNLMQPPAVVQLLKRNGITRVRLFDADAGALRALANTGIKVGVSLPNEHLADAACGMASALRWVRRNVLAYPGTAIDIVDVGNEVFHQAPWLTPLLLPAMRNIQAALASAGLADAVKVSTPIAMDALKVPSFPPSVGEFRDDIARSVMSPMLDFLDQTGSHLSFNIYPYFAYKKAKPGEMDLDFVLFRPNNGRLDPGTGLTYYSMFDAMTDAVFHAVEKLERSRDGSNNNGARRTMLGGGGVGGGGSWMRVPETGYGRGRVGSNGGDFLETSSVEAAAEGTENAQAYNSKLISKVLSGIGTPYRPQANISVDIFALFNENLKPGDEDERNFGLFYPDGTPVYKVDFGRPSWCVANAAVGDDRLQAALDFACGAIGGADCSAIQRGGPCFEPDTKVAHASYAFNDYYQRNGRSEQACDFAGCALVVHHQPTFGSCVLSSMDMERTTQARAED